MYKVLKRICYVIFFLIGSFVSPLLVAVVVALFFKLQTMEGSPSQFYRFFMFYSFINLFNLLVIVIIHTIITNTVCLCYSPLIKVV